METVSQKSHADLAASLRSSAEVVDSLRKLTRLDKLGNSRFSEKTLPQQIRKAIEEDT